MEKNWKDNYGDGEKKGATAKEKKAQGKSKEKYMRMLETRQRHYWPFLTARLPRRAATEVSSSTTSRTLA